MKIPYVNLSAQWKEERENLLPIIDEALLKGDFVAGEAIKEFEKLVGKLCSVDYVVSLNSGTDALILALHILGVGRGAFAWEMARLGSPIDQSREKFRESLEIQCEEVCSSENVLNDRAAYM